MYGFPSDVDRSELTQGHCHLMPYSSLDALGPYFSNRSGMTQFSFMRRVTFSEMHVGGMCFRERDVIFFEAERRAASLCVSTMKTAPKVIRKVN